MFVLHQKLIRGSSTPYEFLLTLICLISFSSYKHSSVSSWLPSHRATSVRDRHWPCMYSEVANDMYIFFLELFSVKDLHGLIRCSAFDMEIIFHSHANKTHFHKKGCAPSIASFWKWGFLELGSGLLVTNMTYVKLLLSIFNVIWAFAYNR